MPSECVADAQLMSSMKHKSNHLDTSKRIHELTGIQPTQRNHSDEFRVAKNLKQREKRHAATALYRQSSSSASFNPSDPHDASSQHIPGIRPGYADEVEALSRYSSPADTWDASAQQLLSESSAYAESSLAPTRSSTPAPSQWAVASQMPPPSSTSARQMPSETHASSSNRRRRHSPSDDGGEEQAHAKRMKQKQLMLNELKRQEEILMDRVIAREQAKLARLGRQLEE
jgi:hypothetical protein